MKIKIKEKISPARLMASCVLVLLIIFSLQADFSFAQAVTQGYAADEPVQRGMIVKIKEEDTTKIEPVSQETAEAAYGVVVHPNDAPVTLSTEGQQVFVASEGKYEILVNDQNGPINPGDYIVVSAISGTGMKVDEFQPIVVARALEAFDEKSEPVGTAAVGDREVQMGRIMADINISGNPLQKPEEANIPEFLRRVAEEIADQPVSTKKLYLSMAILIVSSGVAGSLMYSGVRSAIISIGRNPLSKKSIIRGMFQVVLTGFIIFITGIFGVYLLLKV